jgi:hypothetical protein
MKRLITLILSAALLCPMWAGAQTTTTPSIQGQLHFAGGFSLNQSYDQLQYVNSAYCTKITDLRLNIQSPNSLSPIKFVSGYVTCAPGYSDSWVPFSGTLIATNSDYSPNTTNATTIYYVGSFTLGLSQLRCNFPGNLSSASCSLYAVRGDRSEPAYAGGGNFTYTTAP